MSSGSLTELLERVHPDGRPMWTDEEVDHILPLLIFKTGVGPEALNANARELYGRFALEAQLDLSQSREQVEAAIDRYYDATPGNVALLREVRALLRDAAAQSDWTTSKRASEFLGQPSGSEVPRTPAAGNALLRFRLQQLRDDKDER